MAEMALLILLVLTALAFDFINGFHDAANAISTIVSTRVLSPSQAVLWAAFFNFVAFFLVGVPVAKTIGTGIIHPDIITDAVIFAALGGAIVWNLITWYFGLPSSSSHALIGGLIGVGLVKGGMEVLVLSGIEKTVLFIVLSPAIGMALGFVPDDPCHEPLPEYDGLPGGSDLPETPTLFRRHLQHGARDERRPEDDGNHRDAPLQPRDVGTGLPRPPLDGNHSATR